VLDKIRLDVVRSGPPPPSQSGRLNHQPRWLQPKPLNDRPLLLLIQPKPLKNQSLLLLLQPDHLKHRLLLLLLAQTLSRSLAQSSKPALLSFAASISTQTCPLLQSCLRTPMDILLVQFHSQIPLRYLIYCDLRTRQTST
jgi:hypothetical protein